MPQYKQFTREEELDLFERWRSQGDREAYSLLVESQMAWAKKLVFKHKSTAFATLDTDEALSHAYEGILVAIEKFDPSKGRRLSTLVWHAVRTRLYYCDVGGPIRVISNNRCLEKKGKALKPKRPDWFRDSKYTARTTASAEDELIAKEERERTRATAAIMLRRLSGRERAIVWRHFLRGETYLHMAPDFGISKQRVNEICLLAVKKLRAAELAEAESLAV